MEKPYFLITETQIIKLFEKAFDAKGDIQDLISLERAANKYDITKKFLYKLHKEGKITLRKLSRRTFVSIREIEESMVPMERQ